MNIGAALRRTQFMCLVVAVFAIPMVAQATPIPAFVVSGTVTSAATGAPLKDITVAGRFTADDHSANIEPVKTDAAGEYRIEFYAESTATVQISAADEHGYYDGMAAPEFKMATDTQRVVNLSLKKDSAPPLVYFYGGYRFHASSLLGAGFASITPDIEEYAWLSNGSDAMEIEANDYGRESSRNMYWPNGSGIKSLSWSIDGKAWVTRTPLTAYSVSWYNDRPLAMSCMLPSLLEGVHSIRYGATDRNGNASRIQSQLMVIDKTPPYTAYNRRTANLDRVQIFANDKLMGTVSTFLRTGTTGAFSYVGNGKLITVPDSGSRTVQFYSQDKVGNTEKVRTLKVSAPAELTVPKPSVSSIAEGRTLRVTGRVLHRTAASGYVRVYKLTDGTYKYVSKKAFTEGPTGTYKVPFKLSAGSYRFVTTYGGYTTAWANPPVKTEKSAGVYVY